VNSGGGGGASQAFSEVGVEGTNNSMRTTPVQPVSGAKGSGSAPDNDSGSSHVSEPPQKRIALQQRIDAPVLPDQNPASQVARAGTLHCSRQHRSRMS
jgi:hypothetical protein